MNIPISKVRADLGAMKRGDYGSQRLRRLQLYLSCLEQTLRDAQVSPRDWNQTYRFRERLLVELSHFPK